jgi:hydrophobic/amphiphilic exporter-1 (mainly G- bacteria), HAE1 family
MAVNVSAFSIRKPIPALVLFGVLMLMGLFSFMQLPITRFPNIDVPVISVTVTQPGAAPAELETQVSKRVEDAVSGITGVKNITSTLTDGSSTTAVEFRLEIDTDRALNDVKDAIAKIRPDLPRNVDEPIINRVDIEGQSILTYAVSAPAKTLEQLSWFVDDTVKRNVQGAKGVGKVERIGGVAREIRVTLNPDQLMSLGITAADVNRQLKATNADLALKALAIPRSCCLAGAKCVCLILERWWTALKSSALSRGLMRKRLSCPLLFIVPRAPAIMMSKTLFRSAWMNWRRATHR